MTHAAYHECDCRFDISSACDRGRLYCLCPSCGLYTECPGCPACSEEFDPSDAPFADDYEEGNLP